MSEWKKIRVGDLGRIVTGKTPKTAIAENYGGAISFLTPSDDMSVKYIEVTAKKLTERGLSEVRNCLLPSRSICVSCIGSDLGKVVMTTQETVTNQQINSIIPADEVDADFIYYAMLILGKKLNYISKTSTAVPIVNKSSFSNYTIALPDLPTQRTIADTLSAHDAKIANNKAINHHLEQMAQAMFKSWFVDFEPWDGVMPKDWQEGTIKDTCSAIYNGGTPQRNEPRFWSDEVPWLTSGEVRQAIITKTENFISEAGLAGSSAKWVPPLSTVVALYGATAGQVSMVALPLTTNQAICSLVPKENCVFYNYLCMRNAIRELENQAVGSAQQNISKGIVEETFCLIPDKKTLTEFENVVSPFFALWIANLEESNRLAMLRDTLLPRLMSGELSVTDLAAQ